MGAARRGWYFRGRAAFAVGDMNGAAGRSGDGRREPQGVSSHRKKKVAR
jgi:hypothetical protein